MGRVILGLVVVAILGFAALSLYAYVADLSPEQGTVTVPVTLDAD